MNNIAGINFLEILANISENTARYILILLLISFILSLIFIIVQNYVYDDNSIWLAIAAYFNIILITLAFILYVRTLYYSYAVGYQEESPSNVVSNASYDDSY
uniref:ORF F2L n=1 Tax=Heliothis armigera entomopoxvirus TaxID=10290 RepID=O37320_HAEPV|nr:ORF F2L [Heliothis armigera entomopoxvirus]